MADEQDVFERAGITPEDFGEAAPPEPVAPEGGAESDGQPRDEFGRFAPKTPAEADESPEEPQQPEPAPEVASQPEAAPPPADEAPARFSAEAKALFAAAPPALKAEISRAVRETEAGIAKYREQIEPFRPFLERAKATGSDPVAAIQSYVAIEDTLRQNPLQGLEAICRNLGTDLRSVAAHVMGKPAPEPNAEIQQLRQQVAQYKQQADAYQRHLNEQATQTVTSFAEQNPRFNELAETIGWIIKSGGAADLPTAYQMAAAMRPAPASAPHTAARPIPQPQPQTPRQNLQISGSPSPGSNPRNSHAPRSLDSIFDEVGI